MQIVIDSTGRHFIAIKYVQKNDDGTIKNTLVEILAKIDGSRALHIFLWQNITLTLFSFEEKFFDRLKRLLKGENVGILHPTQNPVFVTLTEDKRTIFDGSSAASLIKV